MFGRPVQRRDGAAGGLHSSFIQLKLAAAAIVAVVAGPTASAASAAAAELSSMSSNELLMDLLLLAAAGCCCSSSSSLQQQLHTAEIQLKLAAAAIVQRWPSLRANASTGRLPGHHAGAVYSLGWSVQKTAVEKLVVGRFGDQNIATPCTHSFQSHIYLNTQYVLYCVLWIIQLDSGCIILKS